MAILQKGNKLGVCVHHSVYKPANNLAELKVQASLFNGWHKSKSWAEDTKTPSAYPYISYHYLMATNGEILKVTDEKYVKYHSGDNFRNDLSFNLHGIAICLTGNYQEDKPTPAMMGSLVAFIRDVERRHKINARVRGHKETSESPTACPGTNIGTSKSGWLKKVIENVNDKNYPPVVENPCQKYIAEVEILKRENDNLSVALRDAEGVIKERDETIKEGEGQMRVLLEQSQLLHAEKKELEKGLKASEDKYATLKIQYNTLQNTNTEVVQELNECKEKESGIKKFFEDLFSWIKKSND